VCDVDDCSTVAGRAAFEQQHAQYAKLGNNEKMPGLRPVEVAIRAKERRHRQHEVAICLIAAVHEHIKALCEPCYG
jgi:hypothetical protein